MADYQHRKTNTRGAKTVGKTNQTRSMKDEVHDRKNIENLSPVKGVTPGRALKRTRRVNPLRDSQKHSVVVSNEGPPSAEATTEEDVPPPLLKRVRLDLDDSPDRPIPSSEAPHVAFGDQYDEKLSPAHSEEHEALPEPRPAVPDQMFKGLCDVFTAGFRSVPVGEPVQLDWLKQQSLEKVFQCTETEFDLFVLDMTELNGFTIADGNVYNRNMKLEN